MNVPCNNRNSHALLLIIKIDYKGTIFFQKSSKIYCAKYFFENYYWLCTFWHGYCYYKDESFLSQMLFDVSDFGDSKY